MGEYTDYHFPSDGDMPGKTNWPELDRHKRIHFSAKQQTTKLKRDMLADEPALRSQVLSVIKNWIGDHIMKAYKKYKAHWRKILKYSNHLK